MSANNLDAMQTIRADIRSLQDRADLCLEAMKENQLSVLALHQQRANPELVEEHRDRAVMYYESFLDLTLLIGKLTHQLSDLAKN